MPGLQTTGKIWGCPTKISKPAPEGMGYEQSAVDRRLLYKSEKQTGKHRMSATSAAQISTNLQLASAVKKSLRRASCNAPGTAILWKCYAQNRAQITPSALQRHPRLPGSHWKCSFHGHPHSAVPRFRSARRAKASRFAPAALRHRHSRGDGATRLLSSLPPGGLAGL